LNLEVSAHHRELGLTDDEYRAITARLGRTPTAAELAMFSVMWSEHCSYKSSRPFLSSLPAEAPQVIVGPGEGAGIVEVAPGVAVAWKIESHNHPSFVEPHNGAATGVGGIVRDVLSMGARPLALLDSLRFGPLDARGRYLVDGVVSGISAYGNSIGVPTVGGECDFAACYAENPLVNVACLGVVEDRVMRGRAEGPGNSVVLFGSATGRDGIGGASVLASASFDEGSATKRPSVQVGDPFTEKLLIEASLELIRAGLVAGLQDLGAGGITCPAAEMAAKTGTGMRLDLALVPLREPGMEPFEILISESQERMLAIVEPDRIRAVLDACERWGLGAAVVGEVTSTGRLEIRAGGDVVADLPAAALAGEAPRPERPAERPEWMSDLGRAPVGDDPPVDLAGSLLRLLGTPGSASRRWIWEQYDHMIGLATVHGPGGDAAVIRLPDTDLGVALSLDGPGRLCYLDPYEGARLAVAEAARNVACTGARPWAVTNCLNFGNPTRPEVMWQFGEVVRGIRDACEALELPVTGGNVSFYNETGARAVYPTPVIGMLGVLEQASSSVGPAWPRPGEVLVLIGRTDPSAFGGSEYAAVIHDRVGGRPPALDVTAERALHALLVEAVARGLVSSAHDPSRGGLAVAVAESAIASRLGCRVEAEGAGEHAWLFSESPSRALVTCAPAAVEIVVARAAELGLEAAPMGAVGGGDLDFGAFRVPLQEAAHAFETGFERSLSLA
jgi:phosphoribosylformylglycinamidine synthase subunit PurL